MRRDDIEIIRELTDELAFVRQFLTEDKNYKKVNELNTKIDELEKKLDTLKVNVDKEYFDNLKKELDEKRKELLDFLGSEMNFYKRSAKDFENRKNYLINVLDQIKKENLSLEKRIRVFNKAHLFFTLFIFTAAAIIGFYLGSKHFINF